MADTGNKVVTISQAARYLGKDVSGGIGDSVITLRQLRAMRDGSKATPTVLPSGYTELEYISASGTQYVDTGFQPNNDTRVVVDITSPTNRSTSPQPFGAIDNTRYFVIYIGQLGKWNTRFGTSAITPIEGSEGAGDRVTIDKNKNVTSVNDYSLTLPDQTFFIDRPLYLLARNNNGAADSFCNCSIYSCQIYDDGVLVRDFVPAKLESDGDIGLYDTIGGQFYGNEGTGSFTAGPVVPHSADPRDGLVVRVSQLARIEIGPTIVSWSTGTDEEIAAMVSAADAGKITLSDYWSAGDTRTVHLSAMPGSVPNASESHAAQDVQMVLTDPGHYTLANGKKCSFVVLQKDCLKETGVMNSSATNSGGWNGCPRRTWCNSVYRNAIPATLRPIFKQFTTYAANGPGSTSVASSDYFALFSEKEVFGSTRNANSSAESKNSQLTWFKTTSNRIKKMNGGARYWWERSRTPYSGNPSRFCNVASSGYADWGSAFNSYGLAPFGCI